MAEKVVEAVENSCTSLVDSITSIDKSMNISTSSLFSKSQYAQVVFHDLYDIYLTDSDIRCRYSLTDNVKPQPGDKIALFKVGWLSVSEYITFERAVSNPGTKNNNLCVTFSADKLPKDESDLYQFCYVTSGNVIAGASVPFGFRAPLETELVGVEDPSDPDLVVYMSNMTQLQANLNKVSDENDLLSSKCSMMEDNLTEIKEQLVKVTEERDIQLKHVEHLSKDCDRLIKEKQELENMLSENSVEKTVMILKENLNAIDFEKGQIQQLLQEKLAEVKGHEGTIDCLKADFKRIDEALKENLTKNQELENEKFILEEKLKKITETLNRTVLEKLDLENELKTSQTKQDELLHAVNITHQEEVSELSKILEENEKAKSDLKLQLNKNEEEIKKQEEVISKMKEDEKEMNLTVEMLVNENNILEEKYNEYKIKLEEVEELVKLKNSKPGYNPFQHALNALYGVCDECGKLKEEIKKEKDRMAELLKEKAEIRQELVEVRHLNEEIMEGSRDVEEEKAALKSRIAVLEYELKNAVPQREKVVGGGGESEKLNCLEAQLMQEKELTGSLKSKVEFLLAQDSEMCRMVAATNARYEALKESMGGENTKGIAELEKMFEEAEKEKEKAREELARAMKEVEALKKRLRTCMKEMVGRVSLEEGQDLREEVAYLKRKLQDKTCCSEAVAKLHIALFNYNSVVEILKKYCPTADEELKKLNLDTCASTSETTSHVCPLCSLQFNSNTAFGKHYCDHIG